MQGLALGPCTVPLSELGFFRTALILRLRRRTSIDQRRITTIIAQRHSTLLPAVFPSTVFVLLITLPHRWPPPRSMFPSSRSVRLTRRKKFHSPPEDAANRGRGQAQQRQDCPGDHRLKGWINGEGNENGKGPSLTGVARVQALRASTATSLTASCASTPAGESLRVSTTACAVASRDRLLCPRCAIAQRPIPTNSPVYAQEEDEHSHYC